MIPEHVAAYAAGLLTGDEEQWLNGSHLTAIVSFLGLGSYPPAELLAAANAWLTAHVDLEGVRAVARASRARKVAGGPS